MTAEEVAALDRAMMRLALREGARGRPSPNPHVGAVIAKGSRILSTGFHPKAGERHAEVVALEAAGRAARGATLYVTFEPCNHFGRTPPCTDAIVRAGIARVVIGCADPAPHVPGATKKLRKAGIEVTLGVRRDEAERLVADFAKHIRTGLPFVTLKAAVTLDGRTATRSGDSKWITGPVARRHAHRMRDASDAVLVGVGTVLADDPELTVRHVRGRDPLRAVVDSRLRTPKTAKLLRASSRPPILFCSERAPKARRRALEKAGAEIVPVRAGPGGIDLGAVLRELGRRDVVRLLVEGGAKVHGTFLDQALADRAGVFVAPRILGDAGGLPLALGRAVERMSEAWRLESPEVRRFGEDLYVEGELEKGKTERSSRPKPRGAL
jgi:diaminohydroxyphosphoribosylaminopyrimidine deaminase/5-amino-6-(5-phosphoribosylamino)uracil reductase